MSVQISDLATRTYACGSASDKTLLALRVLASSVSSRFRVRHESSLTPLLVLYKFKADALNLRGKRKERIGSFPGSYGNRGSGLERVSFDDARRPTQAECAQRRASFLTV